MMTRTHRQFALATLLVGLSLGCAAQTHEHADHSFKDAEQWAKSFDDPSRDTWQQPDAVIRALELSPNMTVADIGAGTGYFAVRLARAVPQGRVFGVDIEPNMVNYLNERAKREGLANIEARQGAADDPHLETSVDRVIVVDTYHHIGAREQYFRRVRAALKPEGQLAIIDFQPDAPAGPPKSSRIPPAQVKAELAKAGFEFAREPASLPYQYFLVFRQARD